MRMTIIPVLVGLILFAGCEGSPVPLDEPDPALFDESVLGSWVSEADAPDPDSDRLYLRLFRFNEAEYFAESRTGDDEPDEWMRLRIYPTELEDVLFANIQCVGCEEREWLLFSYERLGADRLRITAVRDELYKSDINESVTMAEFRSAVAARMKANTLLAEPQTFVRWTEDPELQ